MRGGGSLRGGGLPVLVGSIGVVTHSGRLLVLVASQESQPVQAVP